ncbi:MAG: hypothetical protein GY847_08890 [Proteobacteria bacterium]|nr:hypothetical protein [Pseudomonadota bacterium]
MPWPFRKPKSDELFHKIAPRGLYDLHSHILPGVDDGAADLNESMAMLDGLAALGYVRVAATPHFNSNELKPDKATQETLILELKAQREDRGPEILTGAEILFDDLFLNEEEQGNLPRIGNERTYLIEFGFSPGSVPIRVEEAFFRFQVKGGTLILAHPERTPDFQRDPERIKSICRAGVLLQVDLVSLAGKFGGAAKKMGYELIDEGLVDIVASDLHALGDLEKIQYALKELADRDGDEFERMASTNPRLILEGLPDEVVSHA